MSQWFYHWVYTDLWKNTWSNIFAPSIFTLLGIAIAHVEAAAKRRELERHIKLQRHYNPKDPYTLDTSDSEHPGAEQRN